jgi:hypothetical protein
VGNHPIKGLPVADTSLRDAAVRRKQMEIDAKDKQVREDRGGKF